MNLNDQNNQKKRSSKQKWPVLLRLGVTLVILYFIAQSLDWAKLSQLFQNIDYLWLAAAAAAMIVVRFLMALRWHYVLVSEQIRRPLRSLVKIIFVSQFIGHLLPGSVGIEVVRGYEIAKDNGKIASVTTTLILDRVIGVYAMLFMALLGVIWANLSGALSGMIWQTSLLFVLAIAGWAIMIPVAPRIIKLNLFENGRLQKIWSKLMMILASITSLPKLRQILAPMFTISFVVQMIRCVIYYCLYRALGTNTAFSNFMVFIPLMFVALLIPASIGGLGIREGTLAYFFSTVGVATEVSVGVGVISHFLQIFLSFPVMALWVFNRRTVVAETKADAPTTEVIDAPLAQENPQL